MPGWIEQMLLEELSCFNLYAELIGFLRFYGAFDLPQVCTESHDGLIFASAVNNADSRYQLYNFSQVYE